MTRLLVLVPILGAVLVASACGSPSGTPARTHPSQGDSPQSRPSQSSQGQPSQRGEVTGTGPVTYAEAAELVRREASKGWTKGMFCLDERKIVENDEMWVFSVGAKEYIADGDSSFAVQGGVPVVYKKTGTLRWLPSSKTGTDKSLRSRPNAKVAGQPPCGG